MALNHTVGDINNSFEKLRQELRSLKYPQSITLEDFTEGLPPVFLPIIHYAVLTFSSQVT